MDDVFVVLHRGDAIDERDWGMFVSEARFSRKLPMMLIVPGRAMPDVSQRYDLIELHEKHHMKVAVLSDSKAVLRVVTALKWAGVEAKGFAVDDLDGTLAFLERRHLWARVSSALGPYLERSWLPDPSLLHSERESLLSSDGH
ncbi:MAG: hypothetical protein H6712_26240 [Myxococcales bacterium]|nr:hypothetical protein [Myxococcales bacterium]MCB9717375.1 hypothetical protein [Myxococcales bacterium]